MGGPNTSQGKLNLTQSRFAITPCRLWKQTEICSRRTGFSPRLWDRAKYNSKGNEHLGVKNQSVAETEHCEGKTENATPNRNRQDVRFQNYQVSTRRYMFTDINDHGECMMKQPTSISRKEKCNMDFPPLFILNNHRLIGRCKGGGERACAPATWFHLTVRGT